MKTFLWAGVCALILAIGTIAPAYAGVLTSPGVYFGTGNSGTNHDWTVTTDNGVELGLAAVNRFIDTAVQVSPNIYNVLAGPTSVPTKTGPVWGFDYSFNTHPGGTGSSDLGNYNLRITIKDVGTGFSSFFDVFAVLDNAEYGSGGTVAGTNGCFGDATGICGDSAWGVQNSEPGSIFAFFGDAYDLNANDTYDITLDVYAKVCGANPCPSPLGNPIGSDNIVINVGDGVAVPEPATWVLLCTMLAGMALFVRPRKRLRSFSS